MILLIVESPGKIRKISSYLGSGYIVMASVGHIRDLASDKMSIDIKEANGNFVFSPEYHVKEDRKKVISGLVKAAKTASKIILATDKDREGEAIGFHLAKVLGVSNPPRILFDEITKSALLGAISKPSRLDLHVIAAQEARRMLDRLVGYSLSPLLGKGKSAGRVQSVAVKILQDNQDAIEKRLDALANGREIYFPINATFASQKTKSRLYFEGHDHFCDWHTQYVPSRLYRTEKCNQRLIVFDDDHY